MFSVIPLMIIPLIGYNLVLMTSASERPWDGQVFSVTMISGGVWSMSLGAVLIAVGLLFLFFEILKSTRTSNTSVLDHLFSTIVFIVFLVEFLIVPGAATSIFFLLMMMALVDLMAGFSVSIRSAGRDVSYN
ncbi:MAG: hypothetical protein U5K75_01945 [Ahrensia sp.]|nr:hypothetical protein [Ahrensia sp.]